MNDEESKLQPNFVHRTLLAHKIALGSGTSRSLYSALEPLPSAAQKAATHKTC